MKFTLYRANCRGEERNSLYPIQEEITDAKSMAYAVRYDHVMAGYQGNHRSSANFEAADCIPEDCDNEHSDNPEDWITADTLAEQFPEVAYVLVYSRNHNKPKGEQTARPRFHVYFPTEAIELVDTYVKQKKRLLSYFPYFDKNAQDAARFLYGTEDPQVVWHEGSKSILEFLDEQKFMFWEATLDKIPEGQRNATLSKFAGRIIKRYGDTDKAAEVFFQRAAKCEPPLTMEELECIWKSAQGFYQKVAADPNYVEPEEYASGFQLMPADNSDVGQAVVLAREYGWCLRYSPSTDFVVYNGSYWEESKPKAQGFSQQLTNRQLDEAEAKMKPHGTLQAVPLPHHGGDGRSVASLRGKSGCNLSLKDRCLLHLSLIVRKTEQNGGRGSKISTTVGQSTGHGVTREKIGNQRGYYPQGSDGSGERRNAARRQAHRGRQKAESLER